MIGFASAIILSSLTGCDRNAKDLVPQPSDKFPGVIEIGELEVVDTDTLNEFIGKQQGSLPYIVPNLDQTDSDGEELYPGGQDLLDAHIAETGTLPYFYGQLGQSVAGQTGGATFTFKGTGEEVCLIVDPETVFWSQSIAPGSRVDQFAFPDFYNDDGDLDLFAGMSSYYTGSPGIEIGDFTGFYTDSKGEVVSIEYGECFQTGQQTGMDDAHAGRGTVEYCSIDTDQKEGVEYTVVLETFSVPLDDGVLSFGVAVVNQRCARIDTSECMVRGESFTENGDTRECTGKLEAAQCAGQLGSFCCANPEMCGDENKVDEDLCPSIYEVEGEPVSRDEWCDDTDLCCD